MYQDLSKWIGGQDKKVAIIGIDVSLLMNCLPSILLRHWSNGF
jgi:hypothetical protein